MSNMFNLFLLSESYTNGYRAEMLDILSFLAIFSGIFVIISKNPIVSVLFLIGLFLSISGYLILLGLSFIGLSYLLVYIGAVSILFLFILMLINIKSSEILSYTSNSIPLAIFVAILFNYSMNPVLPHSIVASYNYYLSSTNSLYDIFYFLSDYFNFLKLFNYSILDVDDAVIFFVTGKIWDGNLMEASHITSIGNIIYTSYSIWLIITSLILLLAMVGAIVITIKQKN